MQIVENYPVTIFRNDTEKGVFYSVGLSKKDINGNYVNGYKNVRFKKGVEVANKTKIYIKKAFLDFYQKEDRTIDYIFITDFVTLEEVQQQAREAVSPYSKEDYELRDKILEEKVMNGIITESEAEYEKAKQAWHRDEISRNEFDEITDDLPF